LRFIKTKQTPIINKGLISLTIDPADPAAWKFSMLYEASMAKDGNIKEIAGKYGYTREHFYTVKRQFEKEGFRALQDKVKGPKRNYVRTKVAEKEIIRHRFLDPEANSAVITQKMKQSGHDVSQRSVERTINEYGLQKKGYIRQLRQQRTARLKS